MAKNLYSKQKTIKLVGTLDKNFDGEFICAVETKDDGVQEYRMTDVLNDMLGSEISLTSAYDIGTYEE